MSPPEVRSGPPGCPTGKSRPNAEVLTKTHVTGSVTRDGGAAQGPAVPGRCPACGHDPVTALRSLLAERMDAWRAGRRVARDALERAELRGFAAGWRQGLEAGRERAA